MRPINLTPSQLADELEAIARVVRDADSFEGNLRYEPWNRQGPGYLVQGVYRVGNRDGQGGMRIIGSMETDSDCGRNGIAECPDLATCDRHGREWALAPFAWDDDTQGDVEEDR